MFGKFKTEEVSEEVQLVIQKLIALEERNLIAVKTVEDFSNTYKDTISRGLKQIAGVFQQQNDLTLGLTEVLDKHLEVARLRAGLETTDRGAYDSLLQGLRHMRKNCYSQHNVDKQYQGAYRKINSLIKELETLEQQAHLEDLIEDLMKNTSIVRKDKVKPSNTE